MNCPLLITIFLCFSTYQSQAQVYGDTLYKSNESFSKSMSKKMIRVGQKFELGHIYFEQGKYIFLPSSLPELNDLVSFMKDNPTLRIRLEGHTNNGGDPKELIELSENRVKELKKYLVGHGVEENRIEWIGYGAEKYPKTNRTCVRNRRVDLVIID